jgi:uncharacterized protein YigE (DUF2233 family)
MGFKRQIQPDVYFRLSALLDISASSRWLRNRLRLLPAQLLVAAALLGGCLAPARTITPTASPDWEVLAPGLERRFYRPGGDYPLTQLIALRVDPTYYSFRVHYRPGEPLTVDGWSDALPSAAAFVNANFFDAQNQALGLVVADGAAYGQAYQDMGGMLQVQNGGVRVRSTIEEPYTGEALEQAAQAFPMLVVNGQAVFTNTQGDRISRRTVVAQDAQGRIVLIATTSVIGMKLVDLSRYLASLDLSLVNALNLDGGGSTLLALNVPGQPAYRLLSFDPVPTVLAVYPR